jgi:phosphoglycerate dehydrogenase-like enzyme
MVEQKRRSFVGERVWILWIIQPSVSGLPAARDFFSKEATMKVLVANVPQRRELEPLSNGVELVAEPDAEVEFVVLGPELARGARALFKRLPNLRVVQSTSAGVDSLLPLVPEGVTLCGASGAYDIAVSEWVVAMLLALGWHLPQFYELQQRAEWDSNAGDWISTGPSSIGRVDDLDGTTVLVFGHGSIGRAVAARLAPFGVHTIGIARHARDDAEAPEALPRLLPEADAVVLLSPLTPETTGTVDAHFLARMKEGALLINAARGAIVDTDALVDALRAGHIRAALDVTDPEPLPPEHPLWQAPNLLITPHIAGSVTRWRNRAYRLAGEQLRRYVAGEPLLNVSVGGQPGVLEK